MRCYCKILHISYKDHVTNEEGGAKIKQAIGPHEDLLTIVETQTAVVWPCFPFIRSGQNHLARHSERGKEARQTEKEVGRQHQGMEFGKSQRAVEKRKKWRKLVAVSSVVPQRPSWLRDWWWWWWIEFAKFETVMRIQHIILIVVWWTVRTKTAVTYIWFMSLYWQCWVIPILCCFVLKNVLIYFWETSSIWWYLGYGKHSLSEIFFLSWLGRCVTLRL